MTPRGHMRILPKSQYRPHNLKFLRPFGQNLTEIIHYKCAEARIESKTARVDIKNVNNHSTKCNIVSKVTTIIRNKDKCRSYFVFTTTTTYANKQVTYNIEAEPEAAEDETRSIPSRPRSSFSSDLSPIALPPLFLSAFPMLLSQPDLGHSA